MGFRGFPAGGIEFFLELAQRQERVWFLANKERYERLWQRPMEALLAALQETLAPVYPGLASVQPHVLRIYRDVRFSPDKSPYKTHVAGDIPLRPHAGVDWSVPGIYVHFGIGGHVAAIGSWMLDKGQLERYRAAVADEVRGGELQRQVDGLLAGGFGLASHDLLKRVPSPFAQDHPRADLLKRKGLAVHLPEIPHDLLEKAELIDWLAGHLKEPAPAVAWLEQALSVAPAGAVPG